MQKMKWNTNTLVKLWKLLVNDKVAVLTLEELELARTGTYNNGYIAGYKAGHERTLKLVKEEALNLLEKANNKGKHTQ